MGVIDLKFLYCVLKYLYLSPLNIYPLDKLLYPLAIFFCISSIQSQSRFYFLNDVKKQIVPFDLINNLVVFPLEINGKKLTFILDTGVNKTVLFNLTSKDSLQLNDTKKVFIKGLGMGEPVEAIMSKTNTFRIKNLIGNHQSVFVILDDAFKLSSKMGTTIHGIIGYDLLKDVVVLINYETRRLVFYDPEKYEEPKCRRCEKLPIEFNKKKPFVSLALKMHEDDENKIPVTMLVDLGGSDAIWLFNGTDEEIVTPKKSFRDILGEGLSGTVYGDRSKIASLHIGKYKVQRPTVSFLDTLATVNARKFKKRNGSIGGELLKRFKVWIDYRGKKVMLKKTSSLRDGFYYNMSGLQVVYDGLVLVREKFRGLPDMDPMVRAGKVSSKVVSFVGSYRYDFKPSYKINKVIEDSPAFIAGLKEGDVIKFINGRPVYTFTLGEIMNLFQTAPNKKIILVVERGVVTLKYKFRLVPRI